MVNERLHETEPARALFAGAGISVAEWARVQGFSTGLVYQVLEGRRKCLRGQSHQIAVALGLKEGETMDVQELTQRLKAIRLGASAQERQQHT
jgi:gp16 family phage-associated protein